MVILISPLLSLFYHLSSKESALAVWNITPGHLPEYSYSKAVPSVPFLIICLCTFHVRYAEQWEPINPEEKKRYDREFLLRCQFISASMHKPEGLPVISDVVLDKVSDVGLKVKEQRSYMKVFCFLFNN